MNKPTLTEAQIKAGFHIYHEFEHQVGPPTTSEIVRPTEMGIEHWKKCPCNRDQRLK